MKDDCWEVATCLRCPAPAVNFLGLGHGAKTRDRKRSKIPSVPQHGSKARLDQSDRANRRQFTKFPKKENCFPVALVSISLDIAANLQASLCLACAVDRIPLAPNAQEESIQNKRCPGVVVFWRCDILYLLRRCAGA